MNAPSTPLTTPLLRMCRAEREVTTGAVTSLEDPPTESRPLRFHDRRDAGRRLAELLKPYRGERPIVIGIPRGGVPVAAEVARALEAPLDVTIVRKIGAPQNPEFALGALAEGGVHVLNEDSVKMLGLSDAGVRALIEEIEGELLARVRRYRGTRAPLELQGRTAILVDDGLATGSSALAAVQSLRKRGAERVILAAPVAASESADRLRRYADSVVCVEEPQDLWAVGLWYEDFRPTTDEEVVKLLAASCADAAPREIAKGDRTDPETHGREIGSESAHQGPTAETAAPVTAEIAIPLDGFSLSGELTIPARALGMVEFAHGSGSSRLSPRNRAVARALNQAGFATLLFDLLTPLEEVDRAYVFDIGLLADRLLAASAWVAEREDVGHLPLGYFGASTGAAAALTAAAQLGERVRAVVSRGGRPDLATGLSEVRAATLLIVGGADDQVLELNRAAQRQLRCANELAIVPGATHLFEEPGALEQVSRLAADWLVRHMSSTHHPHLHPHPRSQT